MKTCKELKDFLDNDTLWSIINVYDENLSEMARYERLPNSQLEIHVEGSEGNIPHFHIQIKNGKKENCICHVKLLSAEYLRDKDDPMNTLSSKERKSLNKFMHSKVPGMEFTNWESVLGKWNALNPAHIINGKSVSCPDYTKLREEK